MAIRPRSQSRDNGSVIPHHNSRKVGQKRSVNPEPKASANRHQESKRPVFKGRIARKLSFLFSLKIRLIVPYVLLTLFTAMIGTFVVTRLVSSSARERFVNQLFEASRVSADGILRKEQEQLADLRLMVFTRGVAEAVLVNDTGSLQDLLWPLAMNSGVEAVTVLNIDGREVISLVMNKESGSYEYYSGADFVGFKPADTILAGTVDEQGDKFSGFLDTKFGAYLYTGAPIIDDSGDRIGAIFVGTSVETLHQILKQQSLADIIFLDLNGQLISTTYSEPEGGYGVLLLSADEVQDEQLSIIREVELFRREYLIAYSPLVVRQEVMGFKAIGLSSEYLVDTEITSRNTFAILFSAATMAVIIVGYLISRSISGPISRLQKVSLAIAEGDLEQRTGLRSRDEIGQLAAVFDLMTFRLRRRTSQATRLYQETITRNEELAEINKRLQEAQLQLIQSEKLAAVGQLTAGIVHDVKNPLAVIKGLAEEMEFENDLDSGSRATLKTIRDSASRATRIVSDLLRFARQDTPQMNRQNIVETINTSLRLTDFLIRKGQVELRTDFPQASILVDYDSQQIEQVLINLFQNAIQAMPTGGKLGVYVRVLANKVQILIEDTGTGISARNIRRVFDPFFTTKEKGEGTGLGLSVSYGIISRHEGRIDVESSVGEGTTFTITLPLAAEGMPQGESE